MTFNTLIRAEALKTILTNSVVFDVRHQLSDFNWGRAAYQRGHVPGAHFLDMEHDLSGAKNGCNGRHPLPDVDVFSRKLGELGVQPGVQVVVYDQNNGAMASRLWWMLKHWLGHEATAVLDGGWDAWIAAEGVVSTDVPSASAAAFMAHSNPATLVSTSQVLSNVEHPTFLVVDARAAERYEGRNEPIDPVAGRIPGAMNRPQSANLGSDGLFKPAEQLAQEWNQLLAGRPPEQVVHQCGSGVTACHNLLAMDVAGLSGSRLYPGSWSEWCADASRPVATGP